MHILRQAQNERSRCPSLVCNPLVVSPSVHSGQACRTTAPIDADSPHLGIVFKHVGARQCRAPTCLVSRFCYRSAGTTSLQKRSIDRATFSLGINPPTLVSATNPESPNSSEIVFN